MTDVPARVVGLICTGCVSVIGLDFRPAPALIAVSAAVLVRVPLFKPRANKLSEASFTLLGVLGAFVTVSDHDLGPGPAFWAGVAFGAIASSLLEIGKSTAFVAVQGRLQAALRVFLGDKP